MGTSYEFVLEPGADFSRTLSLSNAVSGAPVTLTGYTALMTISVPNGPTVLTLSTSNGLIAIGTTTLTLTIPNTTTFTFTPGVYLYELLVTDNLGNQSEWLHGLLTGNRGNGTLALDHLAIIGFPQTVSAGTAITYTVMAQDSSNDIEPSYLGTIAFTSTDTAEVDPPNSTLTTGAGTFSATFYSIGSQTLTATDTVSTNITGSSSLTVVNPTPLFLDDFTPDFNGIPLTQHQMDIGTGWITYGALVANITEITTVATNGVNHNDYFGTVSIGSAGVQGVVTNVPGHSDILLISELFTYTNNKGFGSPSIGLCFRIDPTNSGGQGLGSGFYLYISPSGNSGCTANLYASTNGVLGSVVATGVATAVTPSAFAQATGVTPYLYPMRFYVLLSGSTITVSYDSATIGRTQLFTYTSSLNQTQTYHGFSGVAGNGAIRNIQGLPPQSNYQYLTIPIAGNNYVIAYFLQDTYLGVGGAPAGKLFYLTPAIYNFTTSGVHDPSMLRNSNKWWLTHGDGGAATFGSHLYGLANSTDNQHFIPITVTVPPSPVGTIDMSNYGSAFTVCVVPTWFTDSDGSIHILFAAGTGFFDGSLTAYEMHPLTADMTQWSAPVKLTAGGVFTMPLGIEDFHIIKIPNAPGGTYYIWYDITGPYQTTIMSSSKLLTGWQAFGLSGTALTGLTAPVYSGRIDQTLDKGWRFCFDGGNCELAIEQAIGPGDWTAGNSQAYSWTQPIAINVPLSPGRAGFIHRLASDQGPPDHFVFTTPILMGASGANTTFTITVQDAFNLVASNYTGTVHFTSTDTAAVLPADTTITNGQGVFSATLNTVGRMTITAADKTTSTITGNSGTIGIIALPQPTHFLVTSPAAATTGTGILFTVTAQDGSNLTVTSYLGTVTFSSSDTGVSTSFVFASTLAAGVGVFTATLTTVGNQNISANDQNTSGVTGTITGTTGTIVVSPSKATHFAVKPPVNAITGVGFSVTVTADDAYNNVATGYTGTVTLTANDTTATMPGAATLSAGVGTFNSAILGTLGTWTITATDRNTSGVTGTITGTSAAIVTSNPPTHFAVSALANSTIGVSGNAVTVTALDSGNNTVAGYTGTVHFSGTDASTIGTVYPANKTLSAGTGSFAMNWHTPGTQTVSATDTVTSSITGNAATICVLLTSPKGFLVIAPSNPTHGVGFTFTVVASDQFNNTIPTYTGTVHFTGGAGGATLPANSTLSAGSSTFTGTLTTAGSGRILTATDANASTLTGKSASITVA